jgi:inositol phosphorylceramide mannosyltransferase catalytic subunit
MMLDQNTKLRALFNGNGKRFGLICLYILIASQILSMSWRLTTGSSPDVLSAAVGSKSAAKRLLASELMARPLPNRRPGVVPKLFHQSWSSLTLPAKFEAWSKSCREKHPGWEYVLWTDDDNLQLVKLYMPWLLETFQNLKGPIYRADMVRNAYMFLYGGQVTFSLDLFHYSNKCSVYADLDVECINNSEGIFNDYNVTSAPYSQLTSGEPATANPSTQPAEMTAFFGRMGTNETFKQSIPNAWMAGSPRHPFFLLHLKWGEEFILHTTGTDIYPEKITGPEALWNNIPKYADPMFHGPELQHDHLKGGTLYPKEMEVPGPEVGHKVVVLPFYYIYPYSHERDGEAFRKYCWASKPGFNPERCKELISVEHWPSYTITYWSHTWSEVGHDEENLKSVS